MAFLFIKDPGTAAIVRRVARKAGMTQTALVRELATAREAEMDRGSDAEDFNAKLAELRRRFPPTSSKVTPCDVLLGGGGCAAKLRSTPVGRARARASVMAYAEGLMLEMIEIGTGELDAALGAYKVYGKGRHRARLNFGDCACAKTNGAQIVYTGEGFAHTDLA